MQETQLQLAQLEVIFPGPLVKDSQIDLKSDLLTLSNNYVNRIVFVIEDKSNYILEYGDGTQLIHWKRLSQTIAINPYQEDKTYFSNELVYLPGSIFVAKQDVPVNKIPSMNLDYWLQLSGEMKTKRYIFDNQSVVEFYCDITNPMFQVVTGNLNRNADDEYVIGSDGMIEISNEEIIQPFIEKTDTITNGGRLYRVSFFSNSEPIELTGAINVK